MTLQERLAMTQRQDNGMDIILGGIPAAAQQEQVQQLPATALRPKSNHTFKVRTGSPHYTALVDSIRSSGIRTPLLVRRDPVQPGAYEIIAGHRRRHGSELAGLSAMPCIVREMDDDTATILMVDSNIQRENILPSERAQAYKMKLEAIRRKAGRPAKTKEKADENNSPQVAANFLNVFPPAASWPPTSSCKQMPFRTARSFLAANCCPP